MKYLRMKAAEIGTSSTADVVKLCVNDVPQGGLKLDGVRARLRVLDALDKANGVLALEDADAKALQACVAGMNWAAVRPDIVEFCDAVQNLPDAAPEHTS